MTQRYSSSPSTKKILEELIRNSKQLPPKQLHKQLQIYLLDEKEARQVIVQLGGNLYERPLGIPVDWKVVILPGLTMRYVNPKNHLEYIDVLPGDPNALKINPRSTRVSYHHPELKKDAKDFPMKKVPSTLFDLNKHAAILDGIKNHSSNFKERVERAEELLADFYFNLDDIQEIRTKMDFPPLEQEAIEFLRNACACHKPVISKSGGGIISHHPRHTQYAIRAAKHGFNDPTFLKIQTSRGYHTQSGACKDPVTDKAYTVSASEIHIGINQILSMRVDFYDPPCTLIKPFSNFDYLKAVNDNRKT